MVITCTWEDGMQPKTSFDELYGTFVAVIESVTGRPCWRKASMQAQPKSAYSTIYFSEGPSPVLDIVENIVTVVDGVLVYQQQAWGTTSLDCKVEFFRNDGYGTSNDAAIRFRNSLQYESRFDDIWNICGLIGEIKFVDFTTIFRADIESRSEIRFGLYANIADPLPLFGTDISDIGMQHLDIRKYTTDGDLIQVDINYSTGASETITLDDNFILDQSELA